MKKWTALALGIVLEFLSIAFAGFLRTISDDKGWPFIIGMLVAAFVCFFVGGHLIGVYVRIVTS